MGYDAHFKVILTCMRFSAGFPPLYTCIKSYILYKYDIFYLHVQNHASYIMRHILPSYMKSYILFSKIPGNLLYLKMKNPLIVLIKFDLSYLDRKVDAGRNILCCMLPYNRNKSILALFRKGILKIHQSLLLTDILGVQSWRKFHQHLIPV